MSGSEVEGLRRMVAALDAAEEAIGDNPPVRRTGPVHLLAADGQLAGWQGWPRAYVTLCGEVVADQNLPPATCPDDCECGCDLRYCRECLRSALEWNTELDAYASDPGERQDGAR